MKLSEVAESPHFTEQGELADSSRVHPSGEQARAVLAAIDGEQWAARVEDSALPLPARLAAGAILAVTRDPRLSGPVPATCAVAGGEFEMGLSPSEVGRVTEQWEHVGVVTEWIEKETPQHTVVLEDFWMATYPVTNGEYWNFLKETGHTSRPTTWYLGAYPWDRSNHPVAGVQPADADRYAQWLSERTGHAWRLPTEAEWERAARGDDDREFPWGDVFDREACNVRETGLHTTSPVGAFPAGVSPYGVHDMGGNVEEFVSDDYAPYPSGPFIGDHLVESMGQYRIARGGSFSRFGDLTRTRRRHGAFPGPLYPVGFRLATSERPS
ncbi:formylglycine-generating enzyme family protein [Streptomyces sp. CA2R101]|uniref:formylglycine-generating enzyme family protein n=1 Tax=Streptomyces sp. CA2R101 TaxID=3120152 RepID=UPI003008C165